MKLWARVRRFDGTRYVILVDMLWCLEGKPMIVKGEGFKHKYDEEPFDLFFADEAEVRMG